MSGERKLLIFAGPSGGHLYPAFAYAEAYRGRFPEARIYLVTSRRGASLIHENLELFEEVFYLSEFPLPRGLTFRYFLFPLKLFLSFFSTYRIFKQVEPGAVAGFGSFISFPGVLLGTWLSIPTIIHEQNAVPGIVTKALAPYVDFVAVSFPETGKYLTKGKVRVTGLPLRRSFLSNIADGERKAVDHPLRVLIMGGSQGARRLNEVVPRAFGLLTDEVLAKIAVIHITGDKDFEATNKAYAGLKLDVQTYPYVHDMRQHFREANFAITRAGASTLFELAAFGLPSIVVPYPYAESHQRENAFAFSQKGAAIRCDQKDFTAEWLAGELNDVVMNAERRQKISDAVRELAVFDAAGKLTALTNGGAEE